MLARVLPHGRTIRSVAALFAFTAIGIAGCSDSADLPAGPQFPENPAPNPRLRQSAFVFDVNTRSKTVAITKPTVTLNSLDLGQGDSSGTTRPSLSRAGGPDFSILAGDAINLTVSNYSASAVGQFTPGKIRVTFDVNVTNRLGSIELITPTFPTPPAGTQGVVLFPFENVVTQTSGGASVGGDGTDVLIELPNRGEVQPSVDWNGSADDAASAPGGNPFNFFNDAGCGAGTNDCYRYEVFGEALTGAYGIPAGATSGSRKVGFDIDPTVGNFRARLIVAADVRNASGSAPIGTIGGSVTSPQRGALSGVTVSVSGGLSGSTDGTGTYAVGNVPTGPKTVSLSGLPNGCTNPGSQSTTVTNGSTSTVNFTVTCNVPVGTISGAITNSAGEAISGQVVVTPTGGSALAGVAFSGASPASYSVANVPVGGAGTGNLALTGLPSQCTDPGTIPYSGLTSGGTITVNVTVTCTPAPTQYQVSHTWSGTGNTRTLTIRIDMTTRNDPSVNGANADDIGAFQGKLTYDATKLTPVAGNESATSSPRLGNVVANYSTPGVIVYGAFDAVSGGRLGNVGIIQLDFTVNNGATGSTQVTTELQDGTTAFGQSSGSVNYGPAVVHINPGTLNF